MLDRPPDWKRQSLEQRLADLQTEYTTANEQIDQTQNNVERLRLNRQARAIQVEIDQITQQLADLDKPPKTPAAPQPDFTTSRRDRFKNWRRVLIPVLLAVALGALALLFNKDGNRCPAVSLKPSVPQIAPGQTIELIVEATDPEGDPLAFTWTANESGLANPGGPYDSPINHYTAPEAAAGKTVRINVDVTDHLCGKTVTADTTILVVRIPPPSPTATASSAQTSTPTADATPLPPSPTILNYHNGDRVPYVTSLLGTYASGQDQIIRVFVVPPPQAGGSASHLYPQSVNHCDGNDGAATKDGRWEQRIAVGVPGTVDVGKTFDIVVTTATAEGDAAVVAEIERWCPKQETYWPGFAALPPGVTEVQRISVIRSDEPRNRAPNPSGVQLPGELKIAGGLDGQLVEERQLVSGASTELREGDSTWVLVYTSFGKWFPQSSDACAGIHATTADGRWQVMSRFGGEPGEAFDIVAVVANPEAGAFFDRKQREWCAEEQKNPGYTWPGLLTIELPQGITEKDRIQVFQK